MPNQELINWAPIVAAAAGVVSALVVPILVWQTKLLRDQIARNAEQLKLTRDAMQASLDGQMFARLDSINSLLLQNYGLYSDLTQKFEETTPPNGSKAHIVADMILTFYEHVYNIRHKFSLMDDDEWEAWIRSMKQVLELQYIKGYWINFAKMRYKTKYREFIDGIIS